MINKTWMEIAICDKDTEYLGIIFDAYMDPHLILLIFDINQNRLFRYETNSEHLIAFTGDLSDEFSNSNITIEDQYNLLEDNVQKATYLPYQNAIKVLKQKKLKSKKQLNKLPNQLQQLHRSRLIPGTKVKIKNGVLYTVELSATDNQTKLKGALLGDHPEIIRLCTENMLIFEDQIPNLPSIAFDIEVSSPRNQFPIPEEANYKIHSIALYDSHGNAYSLVLGAYPTNHELRQIKEVLGYSVEIKSFISERQLLQEFITILSSYQFVISFNGDNFDLPYIYHRCKKLGVESGITGSNYFYYKQARQFQHAVHIDLYRFYSNNAVRLYAYGGKYSRSRLTDISSALLNVEKIGHDLWFDEMNRIEMITYNVHDAKLTMDLLTFSNNLTWKLIVTLMRLGRMTLSYVNRASISSWIYNWIVSEHIEKGLYVPTRKELIQRGLFQSDAMVEGKSYKGAIVFETQPGIYWNVSVVDFNSLYPSTIKNFNLSYETIRCIHAGCRDNVVPELSHWVCTRRMGIMAQLVGYVREIRVRYYKTLGNDQNPDVRELANTIQAALKVFINAGYGVFGSAKFELFCPPIAESTTAYSRHMLLSAKKKAESMGLEIIYGDTDSIFIKDITPSQMESIRSWSIIEASIELGVDYVFRFLAMSGRKKNYFGITTENKLIIKGLSIKKSNTASFIRDTFEEIGNLFKVVSNPDELEIATQKMVKIIKLKLKKLHDGKISLSDLSHQVSLNKSFIEISSKTPAVQIALQKLLHGDDGSIEVGSQFRVIKCRPFKFINLTSKFKIIQKGDEVECSFKTLEDSSLHDIDNGYYVNAMKKAFVPIFDAFDLDYDESLDDTVALTEFFEEGVIQN